MTEPDALVAFLTARLDEDDQQLRKLLCRAQNVSLELQEPKLLGRHIPGWDSWGDVEKLCVRALREAEADRALIAAYEAARAAVPPVDGWYEFADGVTVGLADGLGSALKIRAARFSDHPGYDPSWSPEKES
jgi:Family of unknown function (DUF6221)